MSAADRDLATDALRELMSGIDHSVDELRSARARAEQLLADRQRGRSWLEIVTAETRPLIVEQVSSVLARLATVGSAWRREEAAALRAENVSINRIAGLFGVTRQRVSALLQERGNPPEDRPH